VDDEAFKYLEDRLCMPAEDSAYNLVFHDAWAENDLEPVDSSSGTLAGLLTPRSSKQQRREDVPVQFNEGELLYPLVLNNAGGLSCHR